MDWNVALCISGHLRTYQHCIDSHVKNLLSVLSPDVFIHTWNQTEASGHQNQSKSRRVNSDDIRLLEEKYSPVSFQVETQHYKDRGNLPCGHAKSAHYYTAKGMDSVYRDMKRHESETGVEYDLIVRLRPDILITNRITDEYKKIKDMEVLYYGNVSWNGPVPTTDTILQKWHNYRVLDCFNFSTKKTAPYIFNAYSQIDQYLSKPAFRHDVFLDFALDNGVVPVISDDFVFDRDWSIRRYG